MKCRHTILIETAGCPGSLKDAATGARTLHAIPGDAVRRDGIPDPAMRLTGAGTDIPHPITQTAYATVFAWCGDTRFISENVGREDLTGIELIH
jgi:hypothetical protein